MLISSPFESIAMGLCDRGIRSAIGAVARDLREFPVCSWSDIGNLLADHVDAPLQTYSHGLVEDHACNTLSGFCGNSDSLSKTVRLCGPDSVAAALRLSLRMKQRTSGVDLPIAHTVQSLIGLLFFCACKCVDKAIDDSQEARDSLRANVYCKFCGKKSEVFSYFAGDGHLRDGDRASKYCVDHTPRFGDGSWNPAYKQACRTYAWFQREVTRLFARAENPAQMPISSQVSLSELYVFNVVNINGYWSDEHGALRDLARRWVDAGLTDRKKEILILHASNKTQAAIADHLGCSQQAVSKQLASIPRTFFLEKILARNSQSFSRQNSSQQTGIRLQRQAADNCWRLS